MKETLSGPSEAIPPPLPSGYGATPTPFAERDRIISLDVVRGFALLGILISNMIFFSQPQEEFDPRAASWINSWDKVADWFSAFLVEGKFYPIFSLLFGIGFFLQMERLDSGAGDAKGIFLRRLWILSILGLTHSTFFYGMATSCSITV
ncbi:DUF418 domain-containing protein [Haloferula sp.]|uniref:DUF418 domain-containing protein n=1 Tax=Haloferula sp. TaxID=2497595 RepID=UPI003C7522AD